MLKILLLSFSILIIGCQNIDFTYKDSDDLDNIIYNKTVVQFYGEEINSVYKFKSRYFGYANDREYGLDIKIEEIKTKRSVQSNQAIKKLDYELIFYYSLKKNSLLCVVHEKIIKSNFSYEPKSSGYNFGSDQSLQRLYDLAVMDNFEEFLNSQSENDISKCLNEN